MGWRWRKEKQRAFDQVKEAPVKAPGLAYYNLKLPTRITTDASLTGLSAIFEQQQPDKAWKPIDFASRKNHTHRISLLSIGT